VPFYVHTSVLRLQVTPTVAARSGGERGGSELSEVGVRDVELERSTDMIVS
jgi:hypothetical protein